MVSCAAFGRANGKLPIPCQMTKGRTARALETAKAKRSASKNIIVVSMHRVKRFNAAQEPTPASLAYGTRAHYLPPRCFPTVCFSAMDSLPVEERQGADSFGEKASLEVPLRLFSTSHLQNRGYSIRDIRRTSACRNLSLYFI